MPADGRGPALGRLFDVRDFGARGDGATSDTEALQAAIDACAAAGGGTVLLASGVFRTGTLFLRDRLTLRIEPGAALTASTNVQDYSPATHKNMYKNESHMDRCLIFGRGICGITITGGGLLDGSGGAFPDPRDPTRQRPMLLRLVDCSDVSISDITFRDPAAWTCAFLYCSNVDVRNVDIFSRANENGDGLDFDGCSAVTVLDCRFDTSDDSICLQASRPDRPCRDVTIERCRFRSRWAGLRVGLLSRGDITRLSVQNCSFEDIEDAGIKIQMCEGGRISNLTFRRLRMRNVPRPVFVTLCSQRACVDAPETPPPLGFVHDLLFEDLSIDCDDCGLDALIVLAGAEARPISDCTLRRVTLTTRGGMSPDGFLREVPELDESRLQGWWPEYSSFGGTLPAHGLFARHVRGLELEDVVLGAREADARPAVLLDDVSARLRNSPFAPRAEHRPSVMRSEV